MKQKNFLRIAFILLSFFTTTIISAQVIYNADFSNNGDGFADHTTSLPPAAGPASVGPFGSLGNQWSLSYTTTPGTDASANIFKVVGGKLKSDDWGGQGIFQSQSIDVSAISTIDISASSINVSANDNTFKYFYILDGGSRVESSNISSSNGVSVNYTITNLDVSGATTLVVGFEFSENGAGDGYETSSFTVTSIGGSATPGITLNPVSGNTNESGTTATFTAALNAQPTNDVVLNISSANTNEVIVLPTTLTFTNANWNLAQTITLTGVDDVLFDGNQDVVITVSVDDVLSDNNYDAVADVTTTVTNEDNDTPPSIGFNAATSTENETNVTFTSANIPITVTNYSGTQIDINVSVTGGTAEVGDYTFTSPTALSFIANGTQNITVDINDDADTNNETIIFTITETSAVTGLIISQATHTLTILDDDTLPNFENFNNSNATASYTNNSFVGNNGITWTYVESRNENGDANGSGINGNALMLRRIADDSKVTSSTISGGIQNFSVKLYKGFTGGGDRQVELFINNVSKGTSVPFDNFTEQTFTVNDINVTGDIIIEIRNTRSTQVIVDDISWTSFNPITATWTGNTNTDWATASNWDTNTVPTSIVNAVIPDVTNAPIIGASTNAVVFNLSVSESDGVVINSGGTLIVNGTSTGSVTYKRALAYNALISEGWHLVSSPVVGETYDNDYVAANGLAINNANNAIATYTTANDAWAYMQTNGGGTFTPGIGYSVKKQSSAGDISFTGTINTSDVSVGVVTGGKNGFNLLGNPFTSYLNSVAFLNGNSTNLVSTDIWVFNQSTSNYEVKNLSSGFVLAPAQGFFVSANAATNLTIAESYQAATGDTFLKTSKTEVTLRMTDGTNNRFAKIYYLDNATTGFDNGYDGETFGGIANSLDIFTHLVANSVGKKYQIQALPNADFENMVIPVGVKATAGKEITFSLDAVNIPDGINVYLEDRVAKKVILLSDANATYKLTLSEALDGIGRFYVHTKASSVLSTETIALQNVSIYSIDASTLRVAGLSEGKATIKIFSILGKQVFENSFNASGVKDMQLPRLASGIYVVQLATEKGTLNKKITLE